MADRKESSVCVSVRARSCVHVCPFLRNKGGKEYGSVGACMRVCVEQNNVRPVKYLEIQLNYITVISLV